MNRRSVRGLRSAVAVMATVALVAGCGSSSDDDDADKQPGAQERTYTEGLLNIDDSGEPKDGGTLSFAAFSEPAALDPAVTIAAGSTGGVEMAAIYDTLMRYESADKDFVPQLAESLEPNDDFSEWTLTLRDGVKFSDGSALDSAAVKWSQERYVANSGPETALWAGNVTAIETPDPQTVVYKLVGPWVLFPSILSTGPGMIVAKASDAGAKFQPIGAGPFTFGAWKPQEELVLKANEGYWDGRPHLDEFRSVFLSDQQAAIDSMKSGSLGMVFVRDADKVDPLLDEKTPGYMNMVAASNIAVINAEEGRPGADVRVRKAMVMGINPDLIRERAADGHGLAGSTIFQDYSRWHGETEGLPYDPEEAKKLLEEAKADGYDGKLVYKDQSDPVSRAVALVVKANLEQVGFEVELDLDRTVADTITAVAVNHDYDVSGWGLSFREGDPFSKMFSTTDSESPATLGMATTPEMDKLLDEFKAASGEADQVEIMDKIQQQSNEQASYLNWGPVAEYIAWSPDLHGVVGGMNSIALLSKAWID
ncbi:ABC transporter substrate-binding protein [Nocardioides sp. YIM 152315]|uniref:ABC transporter substrate-binding protein n=1 Tax=Nocardioides sp. YIM 152315 TaxID=3031760 RepID=UPI0023DBEA93|nr:ABC transporter substrate-binding protein [Nocardioides sp. YIM 152315]MDF1604696.1 ABC transporter substrate-binding protein [Nocardioides sp. YIM 152315]